VSIRSLFVSLLFVILIIAKADSTDIKPRRKCGDFSSPQLCQSVSILLFFTPPRYFSFLQWSRGNVHLPHQTCMAFCFSNHLLVEFDVISGLLTWRHSWISGAMKAGSRVLHIKLISGPCSVLALCQHAVQENMFFPSSNSFGNALKENGISLRTEGKEGTWL